jgi:hypothetical protein
MEVIIYHRLTDAVCRNIKKMGNENSTSAKIYHNSAVRSVS